MEIWDSFEGQTLGQMFATAIREGVVILGEFLISIGEQLAEENGLVGAIGKMLTTVGNFIENKGEQLLTALTTFASWVLTHLRELLALIIGFRMMSTALQITQIAVTAAAGGILGTGIGVAPAIAIAGAGISLGSYAAGDAVLKAMGLAEGGYVPATPGGRLAIIGEGGEGEYVVPESKMGAMGGNSYTINVYSYSTDELKRIIKDVVSGEISKSRLRSGFRWSIVSYHLEYLPRARVRSRHLSLQCPLERRIPHPATRLHSATGRALRHPQALGTNSTTGARHRERFRPQEYCPS
jgi:hypothetical protein